MFKLKTAGGALVTASALVASGVALTPSYAHADNEISIRNGTVYDTSGKQIVSKKSNFSYKSGNPICPVSYVITADGKKVEKGQFLTYYFKNRQKGMATVVLRGLHSAGYKDAIILSFKIGGGSGSSSRSSSSGTYTAAGDFSIMSIPQQTYTGSTIKPELSVKCGGTKLSSSDYSVSYSKNKNVGTATVSVSGRGTYRGKKGTTTFEIVAGNVANATVTGVEAQAYTGKPITPRPKVILNGKTLSSSDYTVSYQNNQNPGTATMTITGKGNYTGTKTVNFTISSPFSDVSVAAVPDQTYTGSPITPKPKVTMSGKMMTEGTDYTLSYVNNLKAGQATGTVTPIGQYSGSKATKFNFKICIDMSKATITVPKASLAHTGKAADVKQTPTVRLNGNPLPSGAYSISYNGYDFSKTGKVTVTATGNATKYYKGSVSTSYTITNGTNPMTVTTKAASVNYNASNAQTFSASKIFTIKNAQGAVTYSKASGDSALTIASNGTITLAKGAAKGNHKMEVNVKAAGNATFASKTVKVSVTISVGAIGNTFSILTHSQSVAYSAAAKTIAASKVFTVKNAQGSVKYSKKSGNSKLSIASNGNITLAKGAAAGNTYSMVVKATAAGNANYNAKTIDNLNVRITVTKATNPGTAKAKAASVKYSKKAQTLAASKVFTISKAKGSVTYSKKSGDSALSISSAGKVTIAKAAKKGTHKMVVNVKMAGNANYNSKTVSVTLKVTVK